MAQIRAFYQLLKTRFIILTRARGTGRHAIGQETARRRDPSGDALRPLTDSSAPAAGGQVPPVQVKRPAEGWELWWPAGLAGMGIAVTVLARWSRKRGGKNKEKQT